MVFIKTRSPAASVPFKGQVTEQTTVKWSIDTVVLIIFLQSKCPLGLQFLNPNKASEMAQIMENIQSHYVPTKSGDNVAEPDQNIIQNVIFDGDQLTEERARNCQWANTLADNETDRLNGITTAFADWHLKKLLLGVGCVFSWWRRSFPHVTDRNACWKLCIQP